MKKVILYLVLVFGFISCDEIDKLVNPDDNSFILDKNIQPLDIEQVFQSEDGIKLIFPANSLLDEIKVQVSKIESVNDFKSNEYEVGKNSFKVSIKGIDYLKVPFSISINYDDSKIPQGREVSSAVKCYVFYGNIWKEYPYILDNQNEQLIINISNQSISKSKDDNVVLLSNNSEIIITDAYSKILSPVLNSHQCDCGWEIDYTKLNKRTNSSENHIYYENSNGQLHGPSIYYWDASLTTILTSTCYLNGVEEGLAIGYWQSGKLMIQTTYHNGKKEGYFVSYFENGNKGIEGNFLNDQYYGLWSYWYEDGKYFKKGSFGNSKENGAWQFWHENGKLKSEGSYNNGLRNDKWTIWYANGNKEAQGDYLDDMRNNEWKYWYEDGTKKAVENFKSGKLHGYVEAFWENGKRKDKGYYTDGEQSGEWYWYDEFGYCIRAYNFDTDREIPCD